MHIGPLHLRLVFLVQGFAGLPSPINSCTGAGVGTLVEGLCVGILLEGFRVGVSVEGSDVGIIVENDGSSDDICGGLKVTSDAQTSSVSQFA